MMASTLQEELDLSAPNKAAMLSLPLEKKWQIWTSRRGTEQADTNLSNNPEDYTARLRDLAMVRKINRRPEYWFELTARVSCSFPAAVTSWSRDVGVFTACRSL